MRVLFFFELRNSYTGVGIFPLLLIVAVARASIFLKQILLLAVYGSVIG